MPGGKDDSVIHTRLEMQQEQNAKAIAELTIVVKSLANSMESEDKELKQAVSELIKVQTECRFRYKAIQDRIDLKKSIINEMKEKVATKANKKDVDNLRNFIHKALWWLFGGMAAIIGFLIKITVFKEG